MAQPTVTGAWKKAATFYDVPPALHVADKRHQTLGHERGPGEYAHEAPPIPDRMPLGPEYFATERVADTWGIQIDNTPYMTHDEGNTWGLDHTRVVDFDDPGGADWDNRKRAYRVHAKDQGASRRQNYREKIEQFHDERYHFFRWPGFGPEFSDQIPALAGGGQRGLNAFSVNNPPLEMYDGAGFRSGITEKEYTERKFNVRIIMRNDARPWTPNLAYSEPDTPPVRAKAETPASPFSGLQRMILRVQKTATQRRSPELPGDAQAEAAQFAENQPSPVIEFGFGAG
jgi:hypothetical protein